MTVCLLFCLLPLGSAAQSLTSLVPNPDLNGPPPEHRSQIPRNFFFGDSLSDSGNIADFLGTLGPGYPGNSFTNGRTWIEYLRPDIRRLLESIDSSSGPASLDLSESLDLSAGGATTGTVLNQQVRALFLPSSGLLDPQPTDRAFIWAGGNDFLPFFSNNPPPDHAGLPSTITGSVANLTHSVAALDTAGVPNITVISLLNLSLSPRGQGLPVDGAQISNSFNTQLRIRLHSLPISANLLWIDSDGFINKAIANPAAYGLTNVTDAAAPFASDGVPSSLSPEEQDRYLFYDDIHPTTETHRQFGLFVSEHLNLGAHALDLNLLTDSTLLLDDRFGFDSSPLTDGQSDFQVTTFLTENDIGPSRRQTTGLKADYNFALSDHLLLGGEFFYADGNSGQSTLESMGTGLDLIYHDSNLDLSWEAGFGGGYTWGDLTRRYATPGFRAESDQSATTFTTHAALTKKNWTIGSLPATWEIGLKQRFVHRASSQESGAASLNLEYQGETLSTTIANLELGLQLDPRLNLELALNPVLFHHGGEITASQRDGLATFTTPDDSGYKLHTARASLIYRPDDSTSIFAGIIAGQDNLWTANLGFGLQF